MDPSSLNCNCAQNCSNNCYNNTCHVVSGLCVYGCRKGWMGPYCQERKFTGFIIEKDFHSVNSLGSMCPYCKLLFYNHIHINQTQHDRCYCNNCWNNSVYSSVHTPHPHKLQTNHLQNIKYKFRKWWQIQQNMSTLFCCLKDHFGYRILPTTYLYMDINSVYLYMTLGRLHPHTL
jgi:hypothetical protein